MRPKAYVDDEFDNNTVRTAPSHKLLNEAVDHNLPAAATFRNLVIASRGNTAHTEIDEVIVSPNGIFCIEYKSHKGLIFGSADREKWTQCIGSDKYPLYNPLWQNYKHTEALKDLLGSDLRAPIHSYVVFTHAFKVTVDSDNVMISNDILRKKINNHTNIKYEADVYERILKTLVYASTKSKDLLDTHISEVNEYLRSR